MTPLARACAALRLPRGLDCLRGEVPLADAEIRLALRQQYVATERLVYAVAATLERLEANGGDAWAAASAVVERRDLPASMVGALAALAMLPEEGAIDADELGLWVEAAP